MAVARVTFSYSLYGSVMQNVFHFKKADYVSSELPTLCTNFRDHFLDVYRNCFVAETILLSVHAQIVDSGPGGDVYNLLLSSIGGGGNDRRVPLMMAFVAQTRTGLGGRRYRGRFFIGAQTVNGILDGVITGTKATEIQGYLNTIADRWLTGTADYGWHMVIFHGTGEGGGDTAITSIQLRSLPGCQRRRELGVGI